MAYSLNYLKNFESFYLIKEEFKPPTKVKFLEYPKGILAELEKESPEAVEYLNAILAELDASEDAEHMSVQLQKQSQTGLSSEEMTTREAAFKNTADDKINFGKFKTLYYKITPFAEAVKDDTKLKERVAQLNTEIEEWDKANRSVFKFDNDVSDKVNNPDDSNKALNALKVILDKHKEIVCCVSGEFIGHTSVIGSSGKEGNAAANQTLSEGRAACIKNMFLAIMPEAKDWAITSVGKGQTEPIVTPDDTEDKQKQNRRVEFKINVTANAAPPPVIEKAKFNIVAYVIILGHTAGYKPPVAKPGGKPLKGNVWKLKKVGSWKSRIQCPDHRTFFQKLGISK